MLLIFTDINDRSSYILNLFFERLIPVSYKLTQSREEAIHHNGPVITYGCENVIPGALHIKQHDLIKASGISSQKPEPFHRDGMLCLFPVNDDNSAFSFDIFAASFYLVSRYEEYLHADRDIHGRFPPEKSILLTENSLEQPVINQYANKLRKLLATKFPDYTWPELPFTAYSTIDVDVAYTYLGRSFIHNTGAAARDLFLRAPAYNINRLRVLSGLRKDPSDTFEWLEQMHKSNQVASIYFILLSSRGKYDRNLDPDSPIMHKTIKQLAEFSIVGLHPSYKSNKNISILRNEIKQLKRITGQDPLHSRQHFLKFTLPETYRELIRAGIKKDYSMGYSARPGFRAGIAAPFPFYDLKSEQSTTLTVYPISYMDGTLKEQMKLSPEKAKNVISELAGKVATTGGTFISLWHNHSVSNIGEWKDWREVFLHSLKEMRKYQSLSS